MYFGSPSPVSNAHSFFATNALNLSPFFKTLQFSSHRLETNAKSLTTVKHLNGRLKICSKYALNICMRCSVSNKSSGIEASPKIRREKKNGSTKIEFCNINIGQCIRSMFSSHGLMFV